MMSSPYPIVICAGMMMYQMQMRRGMPDFDITNVSKIKFAG
jgi:hypothetical protein